MEDITTFMIRNFGPVDEADLDIGKINVIGGHNATGKSTVSKLIYCFLKASCNKRQDFVFESVKKSILYIFRNLDDVNRYLQVKFEEVDVFDEYNLLKEEYYNSHDLGHDKFLDKRFRDIDNSINEIQENGDSLYLSILRNLLKIEFSRENIEGSISFTDDKSIVPLLSLFNRDLHSADLFKPSAYLNIYDVIYIDTVSIFDFDRLSYMSDHTGYLRKMLRDSEDESTMLFDETTNESIIFIEEKINDILKGKLEFNRKEGFIFSSDEGSKPISMLNTSSGVKQIARIQTLLLNRKLKEDSFLIIDEPEVNLHPEWQFKLAEVLVLLAKELNITIYVNTHSPMFIEAMEVFSDYYDLKDDTYYYLTEKSTTSSGYKFKYIAVDDLYKMYNHLSKPYSYIESYRIKTRRNKKNVN